jgi:chemotaxis protein MotB
VHPIPRLLPVLSATLVLACGVPEQKYKAALADTQKAIQEAQTARQKAEVLDQQLREANARGDAAEKRAAELSQRLAELEGAVSAATADASRQRELAAQLTKTRETLESERAAAAAEAERQRQLAAKLEQEKVAASLDADKQRELASQLEAEKTALQKRSAEYEALASSLDGEIKAGRIQVSELQGKVTVRMAERVLFPSGSATVSREGRGTLAKIADAFKSVEGRIIRVEGHTDNVPIKTARFQSNWDLSAARAISVVRILQENGVDPALLGAAGYGEYQPISTNATAEGRAQNRRIEISLAAPLSTLPKAPASLP